MRRRELLALASAALLLPARLAGQAALPTTFGGLRLGTCLYNFRSLPRLPDHAAYIDTHIAACVAVGVGLVEINATYVEPVTRLPFAGIPRLWDAPLQGAQREAFARLTPAELEAERTALRQWRLDTPPEYYAAIAARFRAAGLQPFSYVMTFTPDMTEAEIAAIFAGGAALGVQVFSTNQTKVEMAPRLAPFAEAHGIMLGFHNHTATANPNEVASRDSFERLLSVSPNVAINLDVGHYVASNQVVLEFTRAFLPRITHFHMKDRRADNGPGTPMGEGDAPLAELIALLVESGTQAPLIVEYEYPGTGTPVEETRRCIAFMQDLIARASASG